MNFTENKKNGQYYRVLKDTSSDGTRNYDRYSFVTDASDVIFSDGTNVEEKLGGSSGSITEINREIAELKKSVSDGKRTVATAITDKGVTTATDASFKVMSDNVRLMAGYQFGQGVIAADNRVNTGSTNYKSGYNAGYSKGKADYKVVTVSLYDYPNPDDVDEDGHYENWNHTFKYKIGKGYTNVYCQINYSFFSDSTTRFIIDYSYDTNTGIFTANLFKWDQSGNAAFYRGEPDSSTSMTLIAVG